MFFFLFILILQQENLQWSFRDEAVVTVNSLQGTHFSGSLCEFELVLSKFTGPWSILEKNNLSEINIKSTRFSIR